MLVIRRNCWGTDGLAFLEARPEGVPHRDNQGNKMSWQNIKNAILSQRNNFYIIIFAMELSTVNF